MERIKLIVVLLSCLIFVRGQKGLVDKCANSTASVENCLNTSGIDPSYIEAFAPACTKHDVCYKCGAKFHRDLQKCDDMMLDHLTEICKSLNGKVYDTAACEGVAGTYYGLIYFSGKFKYFEASPQFCNDFWVAVCLGN